MDRGRLKRGLPLWLWIAAALIGSAWIYGRTQPKNAPAPAGYVRLIWTYADDGALLGTAQNWTGRTLNELRISLRVLPEGGMVQLVTAELWMGPREQQPFRLAPIPCGEWLGVSVTSGDREGGEWVRRRVPFTSEGVGP